MKKLSFILSVMLMSCGSLKKSNVSFDYIDLTVVDSTSSAYESLNQPGKFIFIKDTIVVRKYYDTKKDRFDYYIINK